MGAVVIAFAVLTQGGGDAGGDLVAPDRPVPADAVVDGATMGVADAPATLEIWSDFQCPACGVFATDTEPLIRETFVGDGTLRIVHHDAAFQGRKSPSSYDESVQASAGAHCAGEQGAFWSFHDWLFANQSGENEGAFARDRLETMAGRVGLEVDRWNACMDRGDVQGQVVADTDAAAADGIRLTPTLAVNGQRYEGTMSYEQLATLIRDAAVTGSSVP